MFFNILIYCFISTNLLLKVSNFQIVNKNDKNEYLEKIYSRNKRGIYFDEFVKFTKFPIPYTLFKPVKKDIVEAAIKSIEKETCIRFQNVKKFKGAGLRFIVDKNFELCYSSLTGKDIFDLPQDISIRDKCENHLGSVQHEIVHALGIDHEHNRPDRDKYIIINKKNLKPIYHYLFNITSKDIVHNYNLPYDYGSIMHYERLAGHIKNQTTIITRNKHYQYTIGNNKYFSFNDVYLLNKHYCSKKCKVFPKCNNGGYPNPNNCKVCKCPTFYEGPLCSFVKNSLKICGQKILNVDKVPKIIQIKGKYDCYYVLKTTKGFRIRATIIDSYLLDMDPCPHGTGLDIKFLKDKTISPASFCGRKRNYVITSLSNDMLIHYTGKFQNHFFKLRYQSVKV
uniref:Metalloendopeptidase n=1 Tax=Parastrongyloides trichosuri TaxID=131310 RepID=A0A0N4Z5Y5_PARTI